MELRRLRGPVLDTFYVRLRRCGDLACNGRPFTEHRNVPALTVNPRDPRPETETGAPRVDSERLALMGTSFGGFLAARAAAFEHRLAAVILHDAIFDASASGWRILPPRC
jgi:hypothetical protein